MAALLSFLDRALPVLQPCLIAVALGCWGVGFARALLNRRTRSPLTDGSDPVYVVAVAVAIFVGVIAFEFALTSLYGYEARAEITAFCAGGVESVTVNGKQFAPADGLIARIVAPRHPWGHHSHPAQTLRVRLTSAKGVLDLGLGRDSDDPHDYWLFYPRYSVTRYDEVGHVFTDRLDNL